MTDRRSFLRAAGGATLGATAGCLSKLPGGSETGPTSVDVGYIPITDAAPLLVAHEKGFFADAGFDSSATLYRGWSTLAEAFLAGEVNAGHFLFPMTYWMRYARDIPATVLAWDHTNGSAITVASDVTDWSDLAGEVMAVPFWYSTHNVILQMILREKGLEPILTQDPAAVGSDQVGLVDMPPPDMPPALERGGIKGYIVAEPFNALGELEVGASIHRFTSDVWHRHGDCVLTVKQPALRNQPDWARGVVTAVVRAQRWLHDNRAAGARLLSTAGSGLLPYSRRTIDRSMTLYDPDEYPDAIHHPEWDASRVGFYPYPYPSYTRRLFELTRETKVEGETAFLDEVRTDTVVEDLFEYDLVKQSIADVGGPSALGVSPEEAYERRERIDI
ncbi:MAG: ABC transporter substrate-binding protein [Halobacteriaceae archaeon]